MKSFFHIFPFAVLVRAPVPIDWAYSCLCWCMSSLGRVPATENLIWRRRVLSPATSCHHHHYEFSQQLENWPILKIAGWQNSSEGQYQVAIWRFSTHHFVSRAMQGFLSGGHMTKPLGTRLTSRWSLPTVARREATTSNVSGKAAHLAAENKNKFHLNLKITLLHVSNEYFLAQRILASLNTLLTQTNAHFYLQFPLHIIKCHKQSWV